MVQPLVFAVGIVGNILSFLVILAPVPTFYRVYRKKSTESFRSAPYAAALLSATLWLYYALLTSDLLLLSINSLGCLVESLYLTIFLLYAPKKSMVFTVKLVCAMNLGLFGAMVAVLQLCVKGERRVTLAGGIGASFALAVFVAPLTIIRQVMRTKSVEFMPFWLSFFLTLSAVVWFLYGLLIKDFFVATPNVLGLLFGVAQMVLYVVYKNPRKNAAVSEEAAAGQAQQVELKDQQHLQLQLQASPAVAPLDTHADLEAAAAAADLLQAGRPVPAGVAVDIPPPPPPPVEVA
ncbi:bidirectional sugar transporter SWEET12-like [Oryza brachyantha]|uniref:bidirectional sugar transporter SWEET12-like n=1 Tax=Oryza brachyantha TaxID=4533 RepID=UPI001ADA9D25|nr:bidirectional sugar transporter SWEET12-like [Oryza brachyantha]